MTAYNAAAVDAAFGVLTAAPDYLAERPATLNWVIDQLTRLIAGPEYDSLITRVEEATGVSWWPGEDPR